MNNNYNNCGIIYERYAYCTDDRSALARCLIFFLFGEIDPFKSCTI